MLNITGLTKKYRDTIAVDHVDLRIEKGQMVGIIGSSGAGKSTILRLINTLVKPDDGRIFFNDSEVTNLKGCKLRKWRAKCAMIFQQFNLILRLNVITNVLIGRLYKNYFLKSMFKIFSKKEKVMAIEALEMLDISVKALERADSLSGGQQQRVAIARALVQEPNIILADEPIASLDPYNSKKVMESLKKLNKNLGITVILSLHHLDWAKKYCSRIIGMSKGKIVFDGAPGILTLEKVKEIYGDTSDNEELENVLNSTEDKKNENIDLAYTL
jgi:phosphonate transport system ATP-binding protein